MTRIYVGADSGEIYSTEYRKVVLTEEHLSVDGDGIEGIELSDDMSVGDTVWIVGEDWTASGLAHIDVTQRELDEMDAPRKLDGYYERAVPVRGGGDENFAALGRFMDNTDLTAAEHEPEPEEDDNMCPHCESLGRQMISRFNVKGEWCKPCQDGCCDCSECQDIDDQAEQAATEPEA